MTHFPVVVCLDDPSSLEAVLAPFDENLSESCPECRDGRECADENCGVNPRAKWDWWVTGGRWGGYFKFHPEHASLVIPHERQWSSPDVEPGHCDGGPKLALDLDGMRTEAAAEARERYAQWVKLTAGTPEALPWSVFTQNINGASGYTVDQARTEYHSQPRVQAIKDTDFDWFASDPIAELQVPEQVYVERARASAVPGWAVVTTDGRWMEQGEMGWFAMSDATEGSKIGFWEAANAYIESLPDTTFLICIDCHILGGKSMCNPVTVARPDDLLAKGVHSGYEWEVTSNTMGYRCGYVRVPPGHPWHGKGYDEIDAQVHGGLTFAEPDVNCGKGGPDDAWWVGFDCAHHMDAPDPELPGYERGAVYDGMLGAYGTVRSTEYVISECRRLAEQAAVGCYG